VVEHAYLVWQVDPDHPGTLTLERVLSRDETESWFSEVSPARDFNQTTGREQ
jgi:hypothetical protein